MPALDKTQLIDNINNDISSYKVGKVTPEDISKNLIDVVDSVHLLTSGNSIIASNLGSPPIQNTRIGELSLDKLYVLGYIAHDNVAAGYKSNYSNHSGSENTSIGSYSLSCNVYGSGNVAVGYAAINGNIDGDHNVGLGWNALKNNKYGDHNIGIGNAAGYYIDQNDSFQFFLASHDLSEDEICNYPDGPSGIKPLLRGDLLNNKLAVNSDILNPQGTLQVNGDLTPVEPGYQDSLGTSTYGWDKLYINELDGDGDILLNRHLVPKNPYSINLGSVDTRINNIYVDNLHVSGVTSLSELTYNTISQSQYIDRNIYLASSGVNEVTNNPKAYLTDEGIDGGGITIQASGTGYNRNYQLLYRSPDLDLDFLESDTPYSRSHWESNISLSTKEGRHVKTDRVLGRDKLSLINASGYGIFIDGQKYSVGLSTSVDLHNSGDYQTNHILLSQDAFKETVAIISSGDITSSYIFDYDGFNYAGFDHKHINSPNSRYSVSSTENNAQFVLLRDSGNAGYTNLIEDFIPAHTFDIVGSGDSVISNSGENKAALILSANTSFSVDHNASLSTTNDIFSFNKPILSSGYSFYATDSSDIYGLYVKDVVSPQRSQAIMFRDSDGNEFDLMLASGDSLSTESVYWDANYNTFVGKDSIRDRSDVNGSGNTSLGNQALYYLDGGSNNITIGVSAGRNITHGSGNILIGNNAGINLTNESHKLVLGNFLTGDKLNNKNNVYVQDHLQVKGQTSNFNIESIGQDSIIKHNSPIGQVPIYVNNQNIITLTSSGVEVDNLVFNDGSNLTTASGLKTDAGEGIGYTFDPVSFTNYVNLNIDNLPSSGLLDYALFPVSVSGQHLKVGISELSQFLNSENPQMFYECGDSCYNLVISNSTYIDHSKNCSNTFIGKKAGNYSTGNRNSLMIGNNVGENAFFNNPDLTGDIASVFLGYRAGRNSNNANDSIFIGQSAGQDTAGCDNSIFIGNSAGQSSKAAKSIGIGDNVLESVDGENNLEIVADHIDSNRLIHGQVDNKLNIAGSIAGDTCLGRISVGGAARITPRATLEVSAKDGDTQVPLQEWYNSEGQLAAYLDQNGNLFIAGTIVQSQTFNLTNKVVPNNIPEGLECGNSIIGDGDEGGASNTTISISIADTSIYLYELTAVTLTRTGDLSQSLEVYPISTETNVLLTPASVTFDIGENQVTFYVIGNLSGQSSITIILPDAREYVSDIITVSLIGGSTYRFIPSSTTVPLGGELTIYGLRFGSNIYDYQEFSVQSINSLTTVPANVVFENGQASINFKPTLLSDGIEIVKIGPFEVQFEIIDDPTLLPPSFTLDPSVVPASGHIGDTYTGSNGTIINYDSVQRTWFLNNIDSGATSTFIPEVEGNLWLKVTASNAHGSTTAYSNNAFVFPQNSGVGDDPGINLSYTSASILYPLEDTYIETRGSGIDGANYFLAFDGDMSLVADLNPTPSSGVYLDSLSFVNNFNIDPVETWKNVDVADMTSLSNGNPRKINELRIRIHPNEITTTGIDNTNSITNPVGPIMAINNGPTITEISDLPTYYSHTPSKIVRYNKNTLESYNTTLDELVIDANNSALLFFDMSYFPEFTYSQAISISTYQYFIFKNIEQVGDQLLLFDKFFPTNFNHDLYRDIVSSSKLKFWIDPQDDKVSQISGSNTGFFSLQQTFTNPALLSAYTPSSRLADNTIYKLPDILHSTSYNNVSTLNRPLHQDINLQYYVVKISQDETSSDSGSYTKVSVKQNSIPALHFYQDFTVY